MLWITVLDHKDISLFVTNLQPKENFSYTSQNSENVLVSMQFFYFSFTDNEVSMFSNTPGDLIVNTDAGQSFAVVAWTAPTVTDNSGLYTLSSSHSSGSSFSIGITTVTYTVVDAAGNTASYSFNITVVGKLIYFILHMNQHFSLIFVSAL